MHGNINTRDRYTTCTRCGRPFAYDSVMAFCTITSCDWYFGTKPAPEPEPEGLREPEWLPLPRTLEAERAVIAAARHYIASPSALRRVNLRRVVERLDIVEGPSKVIPFVNGRYANVDPD